MHFSNVLVSQVALGKLIRFSESVHLDGSLEPIHKSIHDSFNYNGNWTFIQFSESVHLGASLELIHKMIH